MVSSMTKQKKNTSWAYVSTGIKTHWTRDVVVFGFDAFVLERSDWPWHQDLRPPPQTAVPDWTQPVSHFPLSLSHCRWTSDSEEGHISRLLLGKIQTEYHVIVAHSICTCVSTLALSIRVLASAIKPLMAQPLRQRGIWKPCTNLHLHNCMKMSKIHVV